MQFRRDGTPPAPPRTRHRPGRSLLIVITLVSFSLVGGMLPGLSRAPASADQPTGLEASGTPGPLSLSGRLYLPLVVRQHGAASQATATATPTATATATPTATATNTPTATATSTATATATASPTAEDRRVTAGLVVLYTFEEGEGAVVHDVTAVYTAGPAARPAAGKRRARLQRADRSSPLDTSDSRYARWRASWPRDVRVRARETRP